MDAATRFAGRLKEYQNCEKDLEMLQAKRNDIHKSLSKLKLDVISNKEDATPFIRFKFMMLCGNP